MLRIFGASRIHPLKTRDHVPDLELGGLGNTGPTPSPSSAADWPGIPREFPEALWLLTVVIFLSPLFFENSEPLFFHIILSFYKRNKNVFIALAVNIADPPGAVDSRLIGRSAFVRAEEHIECPILRKRVGRVVIGQLIDLPEAIDNSDLISIGRESQPVISQDDESVAVLQIHWGGHVARRGGEKVGPSREPDVGLPVPI